MVETATEDKLQKRPGNCQYKQVRRKAFLSVKMDRKVVGFSVGKMRGELAEAENVTEKQQSYFPHELLLQVV